MEIEEQIRQNENKLMLLGFSGMAYIDYWNEVAKENNKLKQALKGDKNG